MHMSEKPENTETRNEVVDWVYDTALRPENYAHILKTWDTYIAKGVLAKQQEATSLIDTKILAQHFFRAMEVFEKTRESQRQQLQAFLDEQIFASAVVSMNGRVLASNDIAKIRLPLKPEDSLYDLSLEPASLDVFRKALIDCQTQAETNPKNLSLRILDEDGSGTVLIAEILTHHGFTDCTEKSVGADKILPRGMESVRGRYCARRL